MEKQYIAVVPQALLHQSSSYLEPNSLPFLRLPHPRTGQPTLFLPSHSGSPSPSSSKISEETTTHPQKSDILLEVQSISPTVQRSWFIDQSIRSEGEMLIMTEIDALFLVIGMLVGLLEGESNKKSKETENFNGKTKSTINLFESAINDPSKRGPFLPLSDLIESASLLPPYRLSKPFSPDSNQASSRNGPKSIEKGKGKGKEKERTKMAEESQSQSQMEVDEEQAQLMEMEMEAGNRMGIDHHEEDEEQKHGEEDWTGNVDLIRLCEMKSVEKALKQCCEVQTFPSSSTESEPESFYRPSPSLILTHLRTKVSNLSRPGIGSGGIVDGSAGLMRILAGWGVGEDIIKIGTSSVDLTEVAADGKAKDAREGNQAGGVVKLDPSPIEESITNGDDRSGEKKEEGSEQDSQEMERLARLGLIGKQAREKICCEVVGQYLTGDVLRSLMGSYDFTALNAHIESTSTLAFTSSHNATLSTPSSSSYDIQDSGLVKKKAVPVKQEGSRGVKALEKVNTSKMMKLTSFFTKKGEEGVKGAGGSGSGKAGKTAGGVKKK